MSEAASTTPEVPEPIEVRFGDVVRVVRQDGGYGITGVLIRATNDTLHIDDIVTDEGGHQRVLPTGGTHYGKVEIVGHMDDALPRVIQGLKEAGARFYVPPEQTQRSIEELELEATKGPVMFTPALPRTEEEWAEIMAQLEKEHPKFFKGAQDQNGT